MSVFPGPGAEIIRNEVGEVIGWSAPYEPDPADLYDDRDPGEVEPFECKCGEELWPDDVEAIVAHYEVCTEPASFWEHFGDDLRDNGVERQH